MSTHAHHLIGGHSTAGHVAGLVFLALIFVVLVGIPAIAANARR